MAQENRRYPNAIVITSLHLEFFELIDREI